MTLMLRMKWISRLNRIVLLTMLSLAFTALARADEVRVDFGRWSPPLPADWNNARGITRSGTISLKNSAGAATGYSLTMVKGFTEPHGAGNPTPAGVLGLPPGAVNDSIYTSTVQGTVGGQTTYWTPKVTFEIRGLNPAIAYSFSFYAFVFQNDTWRRDTQFSVRGANTTPISTTFDPTNNSSRFGSVTNVRPNSLGVIAVDVSKGSGNNTGHGFYHLSSFKIAYSLSTSNPLPVVNAGSAKTVAYPGTTTRLVGTATDANGIASVKWERTAGDSSVVIATPSTLATDIRNLKPGSYTFRLTAVDKLGASASSSVAVTVGGATASFPPCRAQASPWPATMRVCPLGLRSGVPYGFVEYLPTNYSTGSAFPVVIFLHGIGELGTGAESDVRRVANFGPFGQTKAGKNYGFVAIGPQEFIGRGTWDVDKVNTLVEHVKKAYKVDARRIHITGLSLGGGGTVAYANKYPEQIASMSPVSTGYKTVTNLQGIVNNGVAVWATHADNDPVVSYGAQIRPVIDGITSLMGLPGMFTNYTGAYTQNSSSYDRTLRRWVWRSGVTYKTPANVAPDDAVTFTMYRGLTGSARHNAWALYATPAYYEWIMLHRR